MSPTETLVNKVCLCLRPYFTRIHPPAVVRYEHVR